MGLHTTRLEEIWLSCAELVVALLCFFVVARSLPCVSINLQQSTVAFRKTIILKLSKSDFGSGLYLEQCLNFVTIAICGVGFI